MISLISFRLFSLHFKWPARFDNISKMTSATWFSLIREKNKIMKGNQFLSLSFFEENNLEFPTTKCNTKCSLNKYFECSKFSHQPVVQLKREIFWMNSPTPVKSQTSQRRKKNPCFANFRVILTHWLNDKVQLPRCLKVHCWFVDYSCLKWAWKGLESSSQGSFCQTKIWKCKFIFFIHSK